FQARLDLDPAEAGRPAQAAALALVEALAGRAADLPHLRLLVGCQAGHTRLTLRQLSGLQPGDAILPDIWHLAQGEIWMTVGTSYAVTAKTDRHKATVKTPLRPIVTGSTGGDDAAMAQEMTPEAGPAAEAAGTGLDAVGVTLAFELGRLTVPLAELREIGAGHVFDLGLAPDEPVDLVVNGSRIGRGEIVEIGERIGVRVVRLYGPEAGRPGPHLGHD
ncbi:YscQ/HrcQ family type III secretion apparatus protein, partial [Methylobacterium radiotolerans]